MGEWTFLICAGKCQLGHKQHTAVDSIHTPKLWILEIVDKDPNSSSTCMTSDSTYLCVVGGGGKRVCLNDTAINSPESYTF
jgi:hypothetical protein